MFLFSVLALPNAETIITIQPQSKEGFYGSNSFTYVTNEIIEQSNVFHQNLQPKNQANLQQAIDKLTNLYMKFQNAYSSNSNYPQNVNQDITAVYWDIPRLINDWKDNVEADFHPDIERLKHNANRLLQNLYGNSNGSLPPWAPGSLETARHVQREIIELNEKIAQGKWGDVDQNIHNLKHDKQMISASYLNSATISKESKQHAQNLDNAIDSILNIWHTSKNRDQVTRDAKQLVNYVDLLLKSLAVPGPDGLETTRHVQREIVALNEKIAQGKWGDVDQNIQNLKKDKQIIRTSYLNNATISKESKQHAQNLDNAIDSILNIWHTSKNREQVTRDAKQLVNYVDLLLKSF
jgi:glycerol-3-phosphate cytidylyltransferase-like family protein